MKAQNEKYNRKWREYVNLVTPAQQKNFCLKNNLPLLSITELDDLLQIITVAFLKMLKKKNEEFLNQKNHVNRGLSPKLPIPRQSQINIHGP